MKKQVMFIVSVVALCATVIGCGSSKETSNSKNNPKGVAIEFTQAFTTETNLTNALKYCDQDAEEFCSIVAQQMEGLKEMRKENKSVSLDFDRVANGTNLDDPLISEAGFIFTIFITDEKGNKEEGEGLLFKVKRTCENCGNWKVYSMESVPSSLTLAAQKGRSLFVAIVQANTERESVDLPSVWPKSEDNKSKDNEDIAGKVFNTSTEYFAELFQVKHYGEIDWSPYVNGVEMKVLASAGVPEAQGANLTGDNIAWYVAKGVTDEMDDCVPVLISRNVNIDQFPTAAGEHDMAANTTQVKFGKANGGESDLPFGGKAFVVVSKNGAVQVIRPGKGDTLNVIYKNRKITLPKGFGYLKTGCKN